MFSQRKYGICFVLAISKNCVEVVRNLVNRKLIVVNKALDELKGCTPLTKVVLSRQMEIFLILLDCPDILVNMEDKSRPDSTALQHAHL